MTESSTALAELRAATSTEIAPRIKKLDTVAALLKTLDTDDVDEDLLPIVQTFTENTREFIRVVDAQQRQIDALYGYLLSEPLDDLPVAR